MTMEASGQQLQQVEPVEGLHKCQSRVTTGGSEEGVHTNAVGQGNQIGEPPDEEGAL